MRRTVAGIGVAVVAASLPACSGDGGRQAATPATTSSVPVSPTTVMIGGTTHTMMSPVNCTTTAAQRDATPPEAGDLTIRIAVHDDASSVRLTLSDLKPPTVDGFAISLKVGDGRYQFPYQAPQSPIQVQATKDGKSYTVTGTGQATTPDQSGARPVTFGIHVTCP
ncbi:lipoprotein LpqH [Mycobacterium sp. HUMS_1102779]|uniref:lipoprotein LpqH n=1 Tax=Mycobacterium sp. HUMS_1102779 TaxID=3383487 RepID=UPI003899B309